MKLIDLIQSMFDWWGFGLAMRSLGVPKWEISRLVKISHRLAIILSSKETAVN
jgi:hypothetical protein